MSATDLAETGAIEQDDDVILFVHRPERYVRNHKRPQLKGYAKLIVAKQRNGPVGKLAIRFLADIPAFRGGDQHGRSYGD